MKLTQDDLIRLANNPARGINQVIEEVENNWFGRKVEINSKTHPFVFATDLILGTTHGLLNRVDDSISKLFPAHARNISDLSKHMSDEERIGIFASPSTVTLQMGIEEQTLLSIAQTDRVQMGKSEFTYKTLLIPKDTEITINGFTFSILNGVRVRYSDKTGYQVVYDDATNNPFFPIQNNLLGREKIVVGNKTYLKIEIPAYQLRCQANENITSNESSGCTGTINYDDYFYACRAFLLREGELIEMRVTYDQDVFDPLTPTLALNIDTTNRRIRYNVPDVYISNGRGLGSIRLYTYTTKGELRRDLTDVDVTTIDVDYQDYRYGLGHLSSYSSGLRTVGGIAWNAKDVVTGGRNARNFTDIKHDFIEGRRQRALPITEINLQGMVENYGYSAVKSIDYVTGRSYSLTRELPVQDNKKFFSAMGCFVGSHMTTIEGLVRSGVVIDNGRRVTIPHRTLFDITDPTTVLVNSLVKDNYHGLSNDEKVKLVKERNLVYTPFHYVIDTTSHQAILRAYHLENPKFLYQSFKRENSALALEVGVGAINIALKPEGYLITLVTESGTNYKDLDNSQVGIQLMLDPSRTVSKAVLPGTLKGLTEDGERVFEFLLKSRFDIDINDTIYLNDIFQFGQYQPETGVGLDLDIGFIFTVAGERESTATEIDAQIEENIFKGPMVGIIETTYKVSLGKRLDNIYGRIRPVVGPGMFKRYTENVPARYEENVYEYKDGELVIKDGSPVLKHRLGDVVKTSKGDTVFQFMAGDIVMDGGQPVMVETRKLNYHWDFIAFDGAYYFSRDEYDLEFARDTKDYFVDVIDKDMRNFTNNTLDRTTVSFQPRSKMGFEQVLINNNFKTYMRLELSFTITYYLTGDGFRNQNLKTSLYESTPRVLNESLFGKTTISISDLTEEIKQNLPSDVVAIKVSALAGNSLVDVVSNLDTLSGFGIRKLLSLGGDSLLTIKEDVEVVFLPHDIRQND